MKKIVIFIFVIITLLCFIFNKSEVLIPNEAIRIRIISNSDSLKDQNIKSSIKNDVNSVLYEKLKDIDNYSDAKNIIKNNINELKNIVNKYTDNYEITYGKNYFPEKEYKGVRYDAGDYESLVINLGESKGKNFWCILFPPLCMIDESKLNNVSYSFFVSKLLNKIK